MATVLSYINESFGDSISAAKIIFYSIPAAITAYLFTKGEMGIFYPWFIFSLILYIALLTEGIHNVRRNKSVILTVNPLKLLYAVAMTILCIVPQVLIFGFIGMMIINFVRIPVDIPHFQLIFDIIIWTILGSIVFTSYLAFAKYLYPLDAFNYKVIFESCIDVLVSCIFFSPQLILVNLVLIGPILVLCSYFNIPYTHFAILIYYSIIFVINISILANFLAQTAFEHIKENNRYYDENFNMSEDIDEDISEKLQ